MLACALLVAGCNKADNAATGVAGSSRDVRFSADINRFAVKATDTAFENGDEIGIFAGAPLVKSNVKATVAGTAVNVDAANPIKWLEGQTDAVAFVGYYPYAATVANAAAYHFSVAYDQTAEGAYAASDLRVANTTANPPADETDPAVVNLNFKHVLSKVVVKIDNQLTKAIADVQFLNIAIAADFNLNAEGAEVAESVSDPFPYIKAVAGADEGGKKVYQLLTVPQTAQPQIQVTLEDGSQYLYSLVSAFTFAKGKRYTAEIAVTEETVAGAVSFTLQVTDWEDADTNPEFGGQEVTVVQDKWSVIGKIMGSNWNRDFVMTDNQDNSWSIDIIYAEGDAFKFRFSGAWEYQYGMWNNEEPSAEVRTIEADWIEATTETHPTYHLASGSAEEPNCNIALPEPGEYTLRLVTFGDDPDIRPGDLFVIKK